MTFSEFIRLVGWEQYLKYCRQKNIQPVRDIDVKQEKVCALLDKNFTKQND
jgi:hypothetical protein